MRFRVYLDSRLGCECKVPLIGFEPTSSPALPVTLFLLSYLGVVGGEPFDSPYICSVGHDTDTVNRTLHNHRLSFVKTITCKVHPQNRICQVLDSADGFASHYGKYRNGSVYWEQNMLQRTNFIVTCNNAGAGLATGSAISPQPVNGVIWDVFYKPDGAAPSSADLTIKEANVPYPKTILNKLNVNTDQWFQPRDPTHQASDGAVISGGSTMIPVSDNIIVTIAQANNGQVFNVSIRWDDMQ